MKQRLIDEAKELYDGYGYFFPMSGDRMYKEEKAKYFRIINILFHRYNIDITRGKVDIKNK